MMIVIDIDGVNLDELVQSWEEIREDYQVSGNTRNDGILLDCAARLAADPAGEPACLWTLGLVMTAPYLTWLPGEGVLTAVVAALRTADEALKSRGVRGSRSSQGSGGCGHASHPYEDHTDEDDAYLVDVLPQLAGAADAWEEERPQDQWRCPLNAAGFARIALDIIEPGSATDIPPRLPVGARDAIDNLSALLEGYPKPWTDVNDEIAEQGWELSGATDPYDRAGRIMVVRAVSWYAVSGMVRKKSVLDDLIEALDKALAHESQVPCEHGPDGHPHLPDSGPAAAELGIRLSHPGGRLLHELDRETSGRGPSLETLLCPAFVAGIAQTSLDLLRDRREVIFGRRDTSQCDAEYLRPDGRLEIERIAERLRHTSLNEEYAEDLALWAARRYEHAADGRERAVLLLTATQAMDIAYPSPAPGVVRDVLPVLRSAAEAPRPQECAHGDEHPELRRAQFRSGLPHFYAPEEFPPPESETATATGTVSSPEAWTCPRFLGEVADEAVSDLERLMDDEDEEEDED